MRWVAKANKETEASGTCQIPDPYVIAPPSQLIIAGIVSGVLEGKHFGHVEDGFSLPRQWRSCCSSQ